MWKSGHQNIKHLFPVSSIYLMLPLQALGHRSTLLLKRQWIACVGSMKWAGGPSQYKLLFNDEELLGAVVWLAHIIFEMLLRKLEWVLLVSGGSLIAGVICAFLGLFVQCMGVVGTVLLRRDFIATSLLSWFSVAWIVIFVRFK